MAEQHRQGPLSPQLVSRELPGARRAIPLRALGLSLGALFAAAWGALSSPEILAGYDALSWLLILVPAFLLSYYRGWKGATRTLAAGACFVLVVQLLSEHVLHTSVDWMLLFLVAVILLGVGLGLGVLSELLERQRHAALLLAYSDQLTGLPNRRLLDFVLEKEIAAAQRGRPLSVVLFDVDGLADYNRRHGQRAGDDALREIGDCLDANMREMNIGGRYKGGEFLAILSGEKVDGAWIFTDRTRESIVDHTQATGERLTVSAGVASYEPRMQTSGDLIAAAEGALRRAKEQGGNCTVCATGSEEAAALPEGFARLPEEKQRVVEEAARQGALERAEIRYRSLFEGVPVGLYRSTPGGELLDANKAMVRMLGYPDRESLLSMPADDVYVDPDARDRWRERLEREGVLRDYEVRLRRYDGSEIWARDNARTVLRHDGSVRWFEGVLEEVTERKHAEEELRAANEKLRAVIEAAPLAVVALDRDGRVLSWNPAAEEMFGWPESEVLGRRLPIVAEDSRGEFRDLRERVLGGEQLAGVEVRRQRRDGSPMDLNVWAAPVYDRDGAATGIMAVLVDVTERRQLEAQLLQSQKMESIGLLAGGIAHDFNNLLTAILGNCELLGRGLADEHPQRESLAEIHTAAQHAASLTRQLLAFSRRQILQPKVLDLNRVVRETGEMLRRLLAENIELVTDLEDELDSVKADPVEIGQVVMNLAVNARDAMPDGGVLTVATANVEIAADRSAEHGGAPPGSYVLLTISDTGVGMDEQTRSRIFEPFFTTKDVGQGTGLGLSMVYGIIKQSGGHVWVESEPGEGAAFNILLPAVEARPEPVSVPGAAEDTGGSETILLVEDENGLRGPVRQSLTRRGYSILEAENGERALEICRNHNGTIDLMVTDIVMPGMNGVELAERVAGLRPDMRVLYTSGYTDETVIEASPLTDGVAFLPKPYTPTELGRKIRELLD